MYLEYRNQEKFINRLSEASEVTIVGISHEQTCNIISKALAKREDKLWDKLTIIFPSLEYVNRVCDHRDDVSRKDAYNNSKKELSTYLMGSFYNERNQWAILEYESNLPFTGTKLIFENENGNKDKQLRIAPILVGESSKNTHYIEIWEGMKAFNEVDSTFEIMRNNSRMLIEWNPYLYKNQNNDYIFRGLIPRKDFKSLHQIYVPIVLIILYEENFGTVNLVLQKRDKFNSRSKFDKYCNISGIVIDLDIFQSLGINPSSDYKSKRTILPNQSVESDLSRLFLTETGIENDISLSNLINNEQYWKTAAVRELEEELNLKVETNQLEPRGVGLLELPVGNPVEYYELFKIFSIKLGAGGVMSKSDIEAIRPKVNLHLFNLSKLDSEFKNGNLAPLLNSRYNDVFIRIFANELKIRK
ncbi:MAG: hypothetical protein ACOYOE_09625 [Chlorobium sp.]